MQPITVVICDFQCHPEFRIEPQALADMITQCEMVEETLILSQGHEIRPEQLAKLRGKRILFAGCPHMEGERFYQDIVRQLRMTEFLSFDALTNVFSRYKAKNRDQMLVRQIEALGQMMDHRERYTDRIIAPNSRVLVYGSGLSGLCAAAELAEEGVTVDE